MANNIYLFLGEEKYLIDTKIKRIISDSHADEYNINSYDCEEVNVSSAVQDALTPPFLSDNKVVLIKRPIFLTNEKSLIEHDINSLMNYLQNPMDSTFLIIDANNLRINEKLEIVKMLRKKANVNTTGLISDIEFTGWLKRQCDLENVTIKDEAVRTFQSVVGKDLVNAKTEVDKLINYVGSGGVITSKTIKDVCSREIQNDIYALSNAILSGEKDKIINTYLDLISIDNDVNRLINLVSRIIRECLLVNAMLQEGSKQADIAVRMKASPSRAYYLVKNARDIPVEKAEDYLSQLADLDYKIKSGQSDAKTAFEFFLFQLS